MNLIQVKGFFFPVHPTFMQSEFQVLDSRLDIPFTCVADRVDVTGLLPRVLQIIMRVIPKQETHE